MMKKNEWKRTVTRALLSSLTVLLVLLGVFLGWDIWEARQATEQSYREWRETELELERLREENRLLERELHALQKDPIYIESVLRQWRMAHPGETVLVGER